MEEFKIYLMGDIWNYYCKINNVVVKEDWIEVVKEYELIELLNRK